MVLSKGHGPSPSQHQCPFCGKPRKPNDNHYAACRVLTHCLSDNEDFNVKKTQKGKDPNDDRTRLPRDGNNR